MKRLATRPGTLERVEGRYGNGVHQRDALNPAVQSHIRAHVREKQPEYLREMLDCFKMRIIKAFKSALARQVRETVEICNNKDYCLLNSREEYNRCVLPTLQVIGPPTIKVQEQENQATPSLDPSEEEQALEDARMAHRKRQRDSHEAKMSRSKKIKLAWLYDRGEEVPDEAREEATRLLKVPLRETRLEDYFSCPQSRQDPPKDKVPGKVSVTNLTTGKRMKNNLITKFFTRIDTREPDEGPQEPPQEPVKGEVKSKAVMAEPTQKNAYKKKTPSQGRFKFKKSSILCKSPQVAGGEEEGPNHLQGEQGGEDGERPVQDQGAGAGTEATPQPVPVNQAVKVLLNKIPQVQSDEHKYKEPDSTEPLVTEEEGQPRVQEQDEEPKADQLAPNLRPHKDPAPGASLPRHPPSQPPARSLMDPPEKPPRRFGKKRKWLREVKPQQEVSTMEWATSHSYKWKSKSRIPQIKMINRLWINEPRKRSREASSKEDDEPCNCVDSGNELCEKVRYLNDPIKEPGENISDGEPMELDFATTEEEHMNISLEVETDELEDICRRVYSLSESWTKQEGGKSERRSKANTKVPGQSEVENQAPVKVKLKFPGKSEKRSRRRFLDKWREPKAEIPMSPMPPNIP